MPASLRRLPGVVHDDVWADELLGQRNVAGGQELTDVALPSFAYSIPWSLWSPPIGLGEWNLHGGISPPVVRLHISSAVLGAEL